MTSAKDLLQDPGFNSLPASDRIHILSEKDPRFEALPDSDKAHILGIDAPPANGPAMVDPSQDQTPHVGADKIAFTGHLPDHTGAIGGATLAALALAPETGGMSIPAAMLVEGGAGALGGAGGEAFTQIYQHAKNLVTGKKFGTDGAPATVDQATQGMKEGAGVGLVQGAAGPPLEAAGGLAGKLGKKLMAPEASGEFLAGGAKEIADRTAALAKEGVSATPAEITQSPGLQWLENKLRRSPSGAEAFRKFDVANIEAKIARRNQLMESMAPSAMADAEKLGQSIQAQLNGVVDAANLSTEAEKNLVKQSVLKDLGGRETGLNLGNDIASAAKEHADFLENAKNKQYEAVYSKAPADVTIPPKNLMAELEKTKADMANTPEPLRDATWNKLSSEVDGMLDLHKPQIDPNAVDPQSGQKISDMISTYRQLAKQSSPQAAAALAARADALEASAPMLDPGSNYVQLDSTRKYFSKNAQAEYGKMGSPESTIYDNLKKATMNDMGSLAEASGNSDLFDAHKLANAANGDYKNYMSSPMFKTIVREKPQLLADTIYAPGNESEIDRFKETFGEPLANRVKAKVTDKLFDSGEDSLTGDMVRARVGKYGETAHHIWSPEEILQIKEAADVLDGVQRSGDAIAKNPILRKAIQTNPTGVVNTIVRKNTSEIAPIELVRRYSGQKTVDDLGEAWLGKVMVQDQNGAFNPQKALDQWNQYGKKQAVALLGEQKANAIESSIKTMAISNSEKTVTKLPGGYFNHPLLSMVGLKMVLHNPGAVAAGLVGMKIAPRYIAKLYLSEAGRKLMTEGLTSSIYSDAAPAIYGKLAALAAKVIPRAAAAGANYLYQKGKNDD